jgi:hypothetical protein
MSALTRPEQGHRIDHHGYAPEIWVGLLLTALFLMQAGPILGGVDDGLELVLEGILAAGAGISLIGAMTGTRWFFPECPKRCSYRFHLVGLPMIILALAWYTYANASSSSLALVALGGGLGLCIEIASVRMLIEVADEMRDDEL